MIPDFGDHAVFIWAAYGAVAFGLISLYLGTQHQRKKLERQSAALKEQVRARVAAASKG